MYILHIFYNFSQINFEKHSKRENLSSQQSTVTTTLLANIATDIALYQNTLASILLLKENVILGPVLSLLGLISSVG